MDKPRIKYSRDVDEFFIAEHCYITELSNTDDDEAVSIARARVEPGVTTHWHHLEGITERYVILEGHGLVEVGESTQSAVTAHDVVVIPPGCRQRITNTGTVDLLFLAVCTPRFRQECYRDLEHEADSIDR